MNNEKKDQIEAIALSYDSLKHSAPRVTAKGKGMIAENIIQIAKDQNIPIQDDPTLVELLSQLKINETIPEELYQVVAEIFAFVYKVDKNIDR